MRKTLRGALLIMLLLHVLTSSGCYLLKQGSYLLQERLSAVPVGKYRDQQDISEEEREFFRRIDDIIAYADSQLGLQRSSNYTSYIKTEKDYVAAVVSAAGEFDLAPYLWKFPLVGSVPYKGFYESEDARKEADRLKNNGYDTWIRGVDAFSTLGYTRDPLYSFMTDYDIHTLAEMLIHEQVHATVWLKNSSQFNEQIASFIGEKGAVAYISERFGPDSEEMQLMRDANLDRRTWLDDIGRLRKELEALYADNRSEAAMRVGKQRIIDEFQTRFSASYDERYRTDSYRRVPQIAINNAFIALYGVYYGHDEVLKKLFAEYDDDLPRLIKAIRQIPRNTAEPHAFIEALLDQEAGR